MYPGKHLRTMNNKVKMTIMTDLSMLVSFDTPTETVKSSVGMMFEIDAVLRCVDTVQYILWRHSTAGEFIDSCQCSWLGRLQKVCTLIGNNHILYPESNMELCVQVLQVHLYHHGSRKSSSR